MNTRAPTSAHLAFDRKATCYDVHAHVQRDTAAWVAEWLPPPCPQSACLEFGAGTGNFTRHLARCFNRLEATDQAAAMVDAGRLALPGITWHQHDAWHPPYAPESWDFVASCSLLQWAEDPVRILRNWRRLLRPDGLFLSGIYIAPSLPEFARLLPDHQPFLWRTGDEWRRFCEEAGFKNVRIETRTREYVYPGARDLLRQLHGTGARRVGVPLSVGRIRAFIQDYETFYRHDGGVRSTWTFCRIGATA